MLFLPTLALALPCVQADATPPVRAHHALVYDARAEVVLLAAGSTPLDGGQRFRMFDDLWCFDGEAWQPLEVAGDARSGVRLAFDGERVVSYGGWIDGRSLGDVRVLDGLEWRKLCDAPVVATEAGFVHEPGRRRFVAFGGSGERGRVHSTTWAFDGTTWTELTGPGPGGRQAFAMVHDARRGRTVLFGGMGATPQEVLGDTWELDGDTWSQVAGDGPSARVAAGCAFDSKRGLVILFGGRSAAGSLADTWAWDGAAWRRLAEDGPPPRAMGELAYDAKRDRVVLFGGRRGWPDDLGDTWEWDGARWTAIE